MVIFDDVLIPSFCSVFDIDVDATGPLELETTDVVVVVVVFVEGDACALLVDIIGYTHCDDYLTLSMLLLMMMMMIPNAFKYQMLYREGARQTETTNLLCNALS